MFSLLGSRTRATPDNDPPRDENTNVSPRAVFRWFAGLILVLAAAGSVAGVYLYAQKDSLLHGELLRQFHERAPGLKLRIGDTEIRHAGEVILKDVELQDRASRDTILFAREVRVTLDTTSLQNGRPPQVDAIRVDRAAVLVTRFEDGSWNWQKYEVTPPESDESPVLPEISIDDLTVRLNLVHGGGIPPAQLDLHDCRFQAVPASATSYDFDGAVELPGAGPLQLSGFCNLKTLDWSLGGHLRNVQADQRLMNLARATTPDIDGHLSQLDSAIERAVPVRTALGPTRNGGVALQLGNNTQVAPRFLGRLDVDFQLTHAPGESVPAFKLLVNVKEGRLSSPAIPITLTDVEARFFRDNTSTVFELENATGDGGVSVSGGLHMQSGDDSEPGSAWFDVQKFPINHRLKPLLPARTLRLFDAFKPDGVVSASGKFIQTRNGWRPIDVRADVHESSIEFHRFRYPTTITGGTIIQRDYQLHVGRQGEPSSTMDDVVFDVSVQGKLADRPFTAAGWWKNPGPATESRFDMHVSQLPLDGRFRNALGEKEQRTLSQLNLNGLADAAFVFYRPPGLDQKTQTFMDATVSAGSLRFEKFPYDITDLTGRVIFNSATKHWRFINLDGKHGNAQIKGNGDFQGSPLPGVLTLRIEAKAAELSADLYNALPQNQRSLWDLIRPRGFCDLTADIHWTTQPGQSPVIAFPESNPVRIYDTRIAPQPFPYDMHIQEAVLSFDPNDARAAGAQHCEIHSFRATHGTGTIRATGWAEAKPHGEWQLHFNDLSAANLVPDDNLRAALPKSWRETLGRLHEVGRLSVIDSEMDFRGSLDGKLNTTAGWKMNVGFDDCTLNAGLDVEHVFGTVSARGAWDGYRLQNTGEIHIESAEVLEMPFSQIRGPYSLTEQELVLGSRRIFEPGTDITTVGAEGRVRAQAYGGELLFDSHVDLREGGRYQFFAEVADARLESYAALHIPDQQNLKGVITAWLSLSGQGDDAGGLSGRGQLRISPAALYEIPVVVKLLGSLSQLNLNVQDRTAFNYAILNFKVADEAFQFDTIDLVGQSISFRGRGTTGFNGAVRLDFYSRPARSRTSALPFISGLFTNWAKVEVTGTTENPQTKVSATGRIDEGLSQFLNSFTPNPTAPIPGLSIPRFFSPVLNAPPPRPAGI